ncbi:hypothetical protein ACFYVL_40135 [Streptomyces sp. NPDC004111]|uniref:hypothetical protein n=1 Tax=Streptomyces sp. NPDC004111 TaxID=3364690 RepID=UPI0036776856
MSESSRPLSIHVDGREFVSREWMARYAGASKGAVATWYKKRDEQPEESRFPEKAHKVDRVDYFDREAFERFHAAHMARKEQAVLPAAPELHTGDPEELVPLREAARMLGFSNGSVIRKYLSSNSGYFPEPTGTVIVEGGQSARAFRRSDLQNFDNRRTGDNTGAAGRPKGGHPARGISPKVEQRIAVAEEYLKKIGGWRRGAGAALAARLQEPEWKWNRAVAEARARLAERDTH